MASLQGQDAVHHRGEPGYRPGDRAAGGAGRRQVAIAAKTAEPHPKLPGTIYTAAEEIEAAGGKALPLVVRHSRRGAGDRGGRARRSTEFGGIDICVNNASAISLTNTQATDMKRYDLMNGDQQRAAPSWCRSSASRT